VQRWQVFLLPLCRHWRMGMRDLLSLACPECKRRNYTTDKNKRTMTDKLELSKYCRFCRKHTLHKEGKIGK